MENLGLNNQKNTLPTITEQFQSDLIEKLFFAYAWIRDLKV